jgi:hypothetical protein
MRLRDRIVSDAMPLLLQHNPFFTVATRTRACILMIVSYVMQLHGALLLLPSRGNTDVTLEPRMYIYIIRYCVHIIVIVIHMFLHIKNRLIRT